MLNLFGQIENYPHEFFPMRGWHISFIDSMHCLKESGEIVILSTGLRDVVSYHGL